MEPKNVVFFDIAVLNSQLADFLVVRLYEVESLAPLVVAGEGESFEIPLSAFHSCLRSSHAMVTIVAQGRTLPGTVCLWETRSAFFSEKHLRVGLSRATDASLVSIGPSLKWKP